mmetsp:Transcript_16688/g.29938  ORF Transcript_16688/g.29938 Transcript_16688/m.29938 type:complete len:169 (+) Transcript_16688:408-914(+)
MGTTHAVWLNCKGDSGARTDNSHKVRRVFGQAAGATYVHCTEDSSGEDSRPPNGGGEELWIQYVDENSGIPYFHKVGTNETQWATPKQFLVHPSVLEFIHSAASEHSGGNLSSLNNDALKVKEVLKAIRPPSRQSKSPAPPKSPPTAVSPTGRRAMREEEKISPISAF